MLFSGHPVSWF